MKCMGMDYAKCLEVLTRLEPFGLARTARDVSVKGLQAMIEIPGLVTDLKPSKSKGAAYAEGFEDAKQKVMKILDEKKYEQNW